MYAALHAVTQFYGSRLVFKGVSLRVEPGQVLLLAGPNGAGKSTLMRLLAGLLLPTQGTVSLGKALQHNRQALAYLGHQSFLYPELTALENLRFWNAWEGGKATQQECEAMLERVNLLPFADEKVKGFSRGMTQRLTLARVLLQNPLLLLLDEPASGLDTQSSAMLHAEIAAAKQRGAAVVWISHHIAHDMALADTVALLEHKRLAFFGPPAQFAARSTAEPAGGAA